MRTLQFPLTDGRRTFTEGELRQAHKDIGSKMPFEQAMVSSAMAQKIINMVKHSQTSPTKRSNAK